ncbi:FAD/FMN-containing dehydrogenases [hydrothermal vent metagenome]|uniref:FAD/FMN-containing dehydrogenases n=1 Tax=hydrothermal vent metagenome TaxID=652676 RepID=A0A1W1EJP0_9ZZZZ
MIKKIVLTILLIAIVGIGGVFYINSQDKYDASKYSAKASKGLEVGSFITFTLPDQFDKPHSLDSSIQKLVVVFTKENGHLVNEFISSKEKGFMKSKKAILIADISKMPVVIRNTFALPSLRKSSYPTALIYDANISSVFKNGDKADKIHLIQLENNRLKNITYTTDIKTVEGFLK